MTARLPGRATQRLVHDEKRAGRGDPQWLWCAATGAWALVFSAPHFYWALGGRRGLGAQTAAADLALEQTWFAAYNLTAACLGLVGAAVAAALAGQWGGAVLQHWLRIAAGAAAGVLLLRGAVGLAQLGITTATGSSSEETPLILLAVEPWFVLGGLLFARVAMRRSTPVRRGRKS